MRVATYNVHDCIGRDRRHDPARIARVLVELGADLIALQEVTLDSAGELVERFEAATSLRSIDGSLFERGVGRYGNLVLTRYPIVESHLHDLSYPGRERRGAIEVVLRVGARRLRACATHLGLDKRERRWQLERLGAVLAHGHRPALVMGDINAWRRRQELGPLARQEFAHVAVRSFPTWPYPMVPLDRILARAPVRVRRCWRHESRLAKLASDHFPVLAELRLPR